MKFVVWWNNLGGQILPSRPALLKKAKKLAATFWEYFLACANCTTAVSNISFPFIGMGSNGGVRPIITSINRPGDLMINSCIEYNLTWRRFFRTDPLLYHKFQNIVSLGHDTYIHPVAQETRIIRKLFVFKFSSKRSKSTMQKWYNQAYINIFLIIELWSPISTFLMKQLKQ